MTGKPPFETVVSAHGGTVLRVCRAVLGPADADDAWSETFLSAMEAYPDLPAAANVEAWVVALTHPADASVEAWLVPIAPRKPIDIPRAAARRPIPGTEPPDPAPAPPADIRD